MGKHQKSEVRSQRTEDRSKKVFILYSVFCILYSLSFPAFSLQPSAFSKKPLHAKPAPAVVSRGLKQGIDHILNNRCLSNGKVGIKIVSLKTGEVVYQRNSNELLIPASNVKLITTAAALSKLKSDYKFKTTIAYDGIKDGNTLKGNLYIKGYGDPKLVTEELLLMVGEIRNTGIEVISGDIIADDSFFDGERVGNGWKINCDSRAYNARIGALSFNFNTIAVDIEPAESRRERPEVIINPPTSFVEVVNKAITKNRRIGDNITVDRLSEGDEDKIIVDGEISVGKKGMRFYRSISNPPIYTATVFKEFLEKEGITVKGRVISGLKPADAAELLTHESAPLSIIIRDLNKMSNNFMAEQILKTMGAEVKGVPGTAEKGLTVVREYLEGIGIPNGTYVLADGSGLSRLNRMTPSQIIKVLMTMYDDFKLQAEYVSSLSIMGVDGSLKHRMDGSTLDWMVRGKTGTLDGVSAVSGYTTCYSCSVNKREVFAFSIIMNNLKCDVNRVWQIQNQIISSLTDKM